MRTVSEVKDFLEKLSRKEAPVVAKTLQLSTPGMSEGECRRVEEVLDIELPESYRSFLSSYDWSRFRLGNLEILGSAQTIIDNNQVATNPFYEFYKANHLLEIGRYEADPICIYLVGHRVPEGEIVCLDHNTYPKLEVTFVSSNFERLIVCAAIDKRLKKEAEDSHSENLEGLYSQIMKAILQVEPRAKESSFWYNFIRGF